MPRFFIAQELNCGDVFRLPENITRHIKVLRLKDGENITLFNGNGQEFRAALNLIDKRHATAQLISVAAPSRESPLEITLMQAISTGERMDFTVQKCVELGVHAIQPVVCAHNNVRLNDERAARRMARWQEIAIAACEQCGRNHVPRILPLQKLESLLNDLPAADARYVLSPAGTLRLRDVVAVPQRISLLIGAEGGLAPNEEQAAITAGFAPLKLGARILRTETAGIAAMAALQTLWGDF
ncbi:MAG: 16S rRNA (uracil(1498)-N(3))-methyltransferase [Neisseria sp.]|nr:16S rRNA (uracil(1498)-N(3))-methyltransferase [Neisseria sp.]